MAAAPAAGDCDGKHEPHTDEREEASLQCNYSLFQSPSCTNVHSEAKKRENSHFCPWIRCCLLLMLQEGVSDEATGFLPDDDDCVYQYVLLLVLPRASGKIL